MTLFSAGEIPLIHFFRDRGGGLRAFAAVLHQNHQNNLGIVVWRERREQACDALLPGACVLTRRLTHLPVQFGSQRAMKIPDN